MMKFCQGVLNLKTWVQYHIKIQQQLKTQQTQSIETTATIVTETFQAEEKILPDEIQKNNINLLQVF